MYICPVCQNTLIETAQDKARTLRCEQGHSFDRHKKGYVNLLLAHNKRSKQPGDDVAMVAGRRAFLNAGYYQTLVQSIANIIEQHSVSTVLDAGCGEGYYLNHILQYLPELNTYGFDISKPAIQAASHYKQCEWAVASSARMPYADASFDLVLSVFSRVESEEFHRVLKPRGLVLFVAPGAEHLLALRQLVYTDIRDYKVEKHQAYFNKDFELLDTQSLQVPLLLTENQQIKNLLSMTPHGQRITKDAEARLSSTNELHDHADFRLYLYQKK